MRTKIIIVITVIIGILILSLFSFSLKEKALKGIVKEVPEYNCDKDSLCTSCIVEGYTCSCGEQTCNCGNKSVDKTECDLL